ncbi:integrase arm-type DNA-binding domain-containing protein [Lysobacter sp. A6]|uniref:Integrase arm-type DNA-binding domain-containing protein n=1 Tax=Noviluteimonas lactosilytica TaxID=2888523 RepID=A0ABS8JLJ6_9GAMM|nr:integrase family protein [Lysobacter lactosilyticus]MCC8364489.1 integrase arm-type DNA-binding domain-containing protein [Lysobacter lactosilyticus]
MAKVHFTTNAIDALPPPAGVHRIDYDATGDIPGFAIQTTRSGTKTFLLVYVAKQTGRERRMVLGKYGPAPSLSLSAARKEAKQKRAQVEMGGDPWLDAKQERQRAEDAAARRSATLGGLLQAYADHLKAAGKPSWKEVNAAVNRHVIKGRPRLAAAAADAITVDDVMPLFHDLTKAGKLREAEKLRAYLRAAYTAARKARNDAGMFAFSGFRIAVNPLQDLDVTRPKEAAARAHQAAAERKWALTEAQLAAYWRRIHADTSSTGAALRFHLLTGGQRVDQLSRLAASDYDADQKTVTLHDTKGRRSHAYAHVVPLIPDAQKALDAMRGDAGDHLFTISAGKDGAVYTTVRAAMRAVADAMLAAKEIDRPFSPGVIRKTVETRLAAKGVPDEVLARLLSHGLGGVQARNYNAHHYDDEKRLALRRLRSMLEPKGKASNVTQFRKRSG